MSPVKPRRSTKSQSSANGSSAPPPAPTAETTKPTAADAIMSKSSLYLPSPWEAALLSVYPLTLILGSLFAVLDPTTRASPYDMASQSHDPAAAPSYFAKKSNLFNQLFVKRGWFWVTVSYALFLFSNAAMGPAGSAAPTRKRLQGVLRWSIVTLWWIFVTQWFFGPAIIDRGFTMTGGACEMVEKVQTREADLDPPRRVLSGLACKAHGGQWTGGHDISGHVFLLVLGSYFLFAEVLFVMLRASRAEEQRVVVEANGEVKAADTEGVANEEDGVQEVNTNGPWDLGVKFALAVGVLSLWMLLITAAYFHTWFEKVTGLVTAFAGIFVVYFLPRFVPSWRAVIGMPGV